ncbi:ArsC/Spx/MgsR family protein [Catellatospora sp. TT07R-123]|uniref:ArsC/Spx/MgsR family protein n=1 Tax=Catellatospora sp. TT07R-123 TaxID=2733863 RepID=UPI001FD49C63|nr:ArsC/Spx/MgsR family protein [Catellatospora sp. TT07R-123]
MREDGRVEMWNNPSCSKCATARETFELAGVPVRLRSYLTRPPTADEFAEVLDRLGAQPWDVCRLGEPVAAELGLADWDRDPASRRRWIDAMAAHPQLIQRPIILLDDGGAVVGRSPEALRSAVERAGESSGQS